MERRFSIKGLIRRREEIINQAREEACRKRSIAESLSPLFQRYGIGKAYLFGSTIQGKCRSDSDLDIYVEDLPPEKYWDLLRDLEEKAGQSVDLYCQRDDPAFVNKIKDRGVLIYEG
jgi:predicted nucleotidyltransferase